MQFPFLFFWWAAIALHWNVITLATISCNGNLSSQEYDALNSLFVSANGENWRWHTDGGQKWYFPSPLSAPCTNGWQGLTCVRRLDSVDCSIINLQLSDHNLVGQIPPELGNLTSILELDLSANFLSGSVPYHLTNLKKLNAVSLALNFLTGHIPSQIGRLEELKILDLGFNFLSGTLPSAMGSLPKLQSLLLYHNYFNGHIDSLFTLDNLAFLYLGINHFSGPISTSIGSLKHSLKSLDLEINCITGSLPLELFNLSLLELLSFGRNSISGTLPSLIKQLTNLTDMYGYFNFLEGILPSEITTLTKMGYLFLDSNKFSGMIPTQINYMASLELLNLCNNLLSATLPIRFNRALEFAYLYDNILTGYLPETIDQNVNLQDFYVFSNHITGTLPSSLGTMSNLRQFYVSSNHMTGTIPTAFGDLASMQYFELSFNQFTSTLPTSLKNLHNLTSLNASSNHLTGSIDQLFADPGSFTELISLDLSMNQLTGTIPTGAFGEKLQLISLYSNCFQGTLPPDICNAIGLKTLSMDELTSGSECVGVLSGSMKQVLKGPFPLHVMSGSIPACLWSMSNLTSIHFMGNGLIGRLGEIPPDSPLVDLVVNNNFLSGSIPLSIQQHGKFVNLKLFNNQLYGTLASSFAVSNASESLDLYENRLSGLIPAGIVSSPVVNVLRGNVFYCLERSELPERDPDKLSYSCGSSGIDDSLLAWFIVFVSLCSTLGAAWCIRRRRDRNGRSHGSSSSSSSTASGAVATKNMMRDVTGMNETFNTTESMDCSVRKGTLCGDDCVYDGGGSGDGDGDGDDHDGGDSGGVEVGGSSGTMDSAALVQTSPWSEGLASEVHVVCDLMSRLWRSYLTNYAELGSCKTLMFVIERVSVTGCAVVAMYVAVCMPVYLLMKYLTRADDFPIGTYYEQYTWMSTAVFMHGASSAGIIMFFLIAAEVTFCSALRATLHDTELPEQSPQQNTLTAWARFFVVCRLRLPSWNGWSGCERRINEALPYLRILLLHIINMIVIIGVNVGFVVASIEKLEVNLLTFTELALGAFKLLWKQVYITWAVSVMPKRFSRATMSSHALFMSIFNFLVGPFLATLFVSRRCLNYAVQGEPVNSFSIAEIDSIPICTSVFGRVICVLVETSTTESVSLVAPFLYSYECSSVLLFNYTPVFIYIYIMALLVPALELALLLATPSPIPETVPAFLLRTSSRCWQRLHAVMTPPIQSQPQPGADPEAVHGEISQQQQKKKNVSKLQDGEVFSREVLMNGTRLLNEVMLDVAVLLTFGLSCPLLAIAVAVKLVAVTVVRRLAIGKRLAPANSSIRNAMLKVLDDATAGVSEGLRTSLWIVIVSANLFWGFVIFDQVADVYSNTAGFLSVVALWLASPAVIYLSTDAAPALWNYEAKWRLDRTASLAVASEVGPGRTVRGPFVETQTCFEVEMYGDMNFMKDHLSFEMRSRLDTLSTQSKTFSVLALKSVEFGVFGASVGVDGEKEAQQGKGEVAECNASKFGSVILDTYDEGRL